MAARHRIVVPGGARRTEAESRKGASAFLLNKSRERWMTCLMSTSTLYPLATPTSGGQASPSQASDVPAEAFAAALRQSDWNEAERQLRAGESQAGEGDETWVLRRSDWYLAQQRWDEAAAHLHEVLDHEAPTSLFQAVVRHKLASIAFMRGDDAGCVAWLSPLLEVDGVANPAAQGGRALETLWVRALHRSRATDRLHRWVAQLDARGQLDPAVAGVASLASVERGDVASARRWIAMGRSMSDTVSAECLVAAAYMVMSSHASLEELCRLAGEACTKWPSDGRTWTVRGLSGLLIGDTENSIADLERAVELAPRYAPAWRGWGWAQILSGKAALAEQSFLSALKLDDKHSESHGGLAIALFVQQRTSDARDCSSECSRLNAASPSGAYAERLLSGDLQAGLNLSEILARLV